METGKLADLLKIGLTEGEAKVYAALLELGPSSVGPITKRTRVSYSNIYEILERLMNKGIVTIIVKNNIRNFQPVSPSNLVKYLDKKQEELDQEKKILEDALPKIEALQGVHPKQEAMMFTGTKGLRAAYAELFRDPDPNEENFWIYVHDKSYAETSDKFYVKHWAEIAKNIRSRGIADESYRESEYIKEFVKKHQFRHVNFPIISHGEVYKDKFMLVSWDDPVTTVLVHAKHVSDNFRKYFESVWKVAKP